MKRWNEDMEFPNAQHFQTGITMRHELSGVEFP